MIAEEIKRQVNLVDFISSQIPLRRSGSGFVGLCPFHQEKTPSFHISPAKQVWHCFGCGAGGDVFSFVMKREGCSFRQAVDRVAAWAGISVSKSKEKQKEILQQRNKARQVAEGVWTKALALMEANYGRTLRQMDVTLVWLQRRMKQLHEGASERFPGELEFAWAALADIYHNQAFYDAAYAILAYAPTIKKIEFAMHPERQREIANQILESGALKDSRGRVHVL